jgi:hypothetical protein
MSRVVRKIVVDIGPAGSAHAMHFDDFDLGFLGDKQVERASEIVYSTASGLWNIILAGETHPVPEAKGFAGYEVARRFEVEWFQEARESGVPPSSFHGRVIAGTKRFGCSYLPICD